MRKLPLLHLGMRRTQHGQNAMRDSGCATKPIGNWPTAETKKISRRLGICVRWEEAEVKSETSGFAFPLSSALISSSGHSTKWASRLPRDVLFLSRVYVSWKRVRDVHERVARSSVYASQRKRKSKPDEALALLKRIGPLSRPIVKNHERSLPCLAEFFPMKSALLREWQSIDT